MREGAGEKPMTMIHCECPDDIIVIDPARYHGEPIRVSCGHRHTIVYSPMKFVSAEVGHLQQQVTALREALALAKSMILSGESMSPVAQQQIDTALRSP